MKALMHRLQALLGAQSAGMKALTMPVFVVLMLAMMVLPLPPVVLDILFTFNIALSLVVILATLAACLAWYQVKLDGHYLMLAVLTFFVSSQLFERAAARGRGAGDVERELSVGLQ